MATTLSYRCKQSGGLRCDTPGSANLSPSAASEELQPRRRQADPLVSATVDTATVGAATVDAATVDAAALNLTANFTNTTNSTNSTNTTNTTEITTAAKPKCYYRSLNSSGIEGWGDEDCSYQNQSKIYSVFSPTIDKFAAWSVLCRPRANRVSAG